MAGNSNSGRRPLPTSVLRQRNTYRPAEHRDRCDELYGGDPQMPRNLDPDAEKMWHQLLEATPAGVLAAADTSMLSGLVRWWSIWKSADAKVQETADGDIKLHRNCVLLAGHAWDRFARLAMDFGLTPTARTKLKASGNAGDLDDPLLALYGHLVDSDSA